MRINVGDLLKGRVSLIELDFTESSELYVPYLEDKDIKIPDGVKFTGTITNGRGTLFLQGSLKYMYVINCARCLKEKTGIIDISVSQSIAGPAGGIGDIEYKYQENEVDLQDILKDEILLNMPIKYVCAENCKGLCPFCGTDLNMSSCSCKIEDEDPRLSVLKNYKIN